MRLKKSKDEKKLIAEQNQIKKQSICLAVYDLPEGVEGFTFVTKYDHANKKHIKKLFIYKSK